ncbi:hypothetical protein F383_27004 [Gossypium arboreum]|uniref:Uncharacterized protein n=1 Tax=Gossypium arboreum TaxID=29729 RepID=A0A0B0P458_GOSAR|nr:hypothetical protein F383_27004 [Gossypium arboreum]
MGSARIRPCDTLVAVLRFCQIDTAVWSACVRRSRPY